MATFTVENSRLMAAKSAEVRRQAAELKRQAEASRINNPAQVEPEAADSFRDAMLVNVRTKIKAILERMDTELDADELDSKVLKELTDALYRFETMEQKLSMRSAPAAMKPTQSKQPKSRASHASPTFIDEPPAAPINDPNEPNG